MSLEDLAGDRPRPSSPPWGTTPEPLKTPKEGSGALPRPKTRTEMILSRQEKSEAIAKRQLMVEQKLQEQKVAAPAFGNDERGDWWTLVEGYTENAMDALASSPRIQRYVGNRARAHAAERPDPFHTHEVPLKRTMPRVADKITSGPPPPADAEAYSTPRRAVNHFTDDIFAWKWRLNAHGDLDEKGKNKFLHRNETEPAYSSLPSVFTGCTLDPQGSIRRTPPSPQHAIALRALCALTVNKPEAATLARCAMRQRKQRRETMKAAWSAAQQNDYEAAISVTESTSHASDKSSAASGHSSEAGDWIEGHPVPASTPPESNRRRYSRLCGQG